MRDVSRYPDGTELMLAADVLVTDYSSMMFDFANTGRPMLFFTYDLDGYRDDIRGFYFDFAATVPGPLLATSDELAEALQRPRRRARALQRPLRRVRGQVLRARRRWRLGSRGRPRLQPMTLRSFRARLVPSVRARSRGLVRAALLRYVRARPSAEESAVAQRRVIILLMTAWGMGGTIRTNLNLAGHLADHYDVEIVSVGRGREVPFFGDFPPGVRVVTLEDAPQGDAGSAPPVGPAAAATSSERADPSG